MRKWLRWGWILTFAGDVAFSLVALFILFNFFEKANALTFRLYIFWGSLLGLIVYMRLLSSMTTRLMFKIFAFLSVTQRLIRKGLWIPYQGLHIVMKPPYVILRWLGLLLYRLGEMFIFGPLWKVIEDAREWWSKHFPPRTNG